MRRPRLILDDGTPASLPRWARDEIVRLRLREAELAQTVGTMVDAIADQGRGPVPYLIVAGEDARAVVSKLRADGFTDCYPISVRGHVVPLAALEQWLVLYGAFRT